MTMWGGVGGTAGGGREPCRSKAGSEGKKQCVCGGGAALGLS